MAVSEANVVAYLSEKLGFELDPNVLEPQEQLLVDRMKDVLNNTKGGVQSEGIDDLSVTYFAQQDPLIREMLNTMRKVKW